MNFMITDAISSYLRHIQVDIRTPSDENTGI